MPDSPVSPDLPNSPNPPAPPDTVPAPGTLAYLPKSEIARLVDLLRDDGFQVIGPRLVDGVVMLRPIHSASDLASAIHDHQEPGRYRTREGPPESLFQGYVNGPDSPKRYLSPPSQQLFRMHVDGQEFHIDEGPPDPPPMAFLGVRPCDLAAMHIQDQVFRGDGDKPNRFRCELDTWFQEARRKALVIALNCTHPGGTCFCHSMGTGPEAKDGFDLALTELRAGFVTTVGTRKGAELLARLRWQEPSPAELELAELRIEQARQSMGRSLDTHRITEVLDRNLDHPRWEKIARRCLGCGNCAMVCPTCTCSSMVDTSDLNGNGVARTKVWDVCFTHQFSYTTAGPVRNTIKARYRHWLRHKLGTWERQFGTSGCVGCGRCITWCPVGIDITEEMRAIRAGEAVESPEDRRPAYGRSN